uniref:Clathrin_bdg domain-containing protein n=1 Tax=Steinernema glaseri TaxID=37863 RepID=A0A1I8A798_9BILA
MYEEDDDEFGEFEEFGDFAGASTAETCPVKPSPAGGDNTSGGNWKPPEEQEEEGENEDWAAEFPEFSPETSAPDSFVNDSPHVSIVPTIEHVPTIEGLLEEEDFWSVDSQWNEDEGIDDDDVFDILADLDIDEISDDCKSSLKLWRDLRIVEEALALKFQWKSSAANTVLLRTLDMDVKKAEIKNSYLPAFAQQLVGDGGVLKPTLHAVSSTGADSPPQPSTAEASSATVASLSVEPVTFNWSDSGMVNPLTSSSVTAASEMLDFDFLVANEQKESSDGSILSSALQRDLDKLGLSSSEEPGRAAATTQQSSSWNVDELLKKQQATRQSSPCEMTNGKLPQSRSRNELSLDAQALHDSLPDLDYMLSNVLMFPLPKTAGT